jgi:hypothetical protein
MRRLRHAAPLVAQVVDADGARPPEDEVDVRARRAHQARVDPLALAQEDAVDVLLVVPEVEGRLAAARPAAVDLHRARAGVVVRLVAVARRQLAAEEAERGGDVQPSPARL